jgi:hypothetical protein
MEKKNFKSAFDATQSVDQEQESEMQDANEIKLMTNLATSR